MKQRLKNIFSLDYRALALMRIGFGITLICDLIQRAQDLYVFYDDRGALPRSVILDNFGSIWNWSIHMMIGTWQGEAILFALAAIAASALMVGYRTTLATVVSWILLISLQNRNPMILQGGDIIFRVILFWAMFLPWGAYLSIDSIRNQKKLYSKNYFGAASIAYVLQIVFFYFMSGFLKSGAAWHNGTAILQALRIDQLNTSFGFWLTSFPALLAILTSVVFCLELYGSLLLLSPLATGPVRTITIFLFACLQLGMNVSMHLGLFGVISVVITLGLLPTWFWKHIYPWKRKVLTPKKSKLSAIYYDADCGFCSTIVFTLKRVLWFSKSIEIKKSTSDKEIAIEMTRENSWIVVGRNGAHYYKAQALARVLKSSPLFFIFGYILSIPLIQKIADKAYTYIALRRLQICTPEEIENKKGHNAYSLKNFVIIFLLIYVAVWNIRTIPKYSNTLITPPPFIADITRLDQRFDMFSPFPATNDGWYVIPAQLKNGAEIDLFQNGKAVSYAKPNHVADGYSNQRWQKYMMNFESDDYKDERLYYGRYLCREWNKVHDGGSTLQTFKIIFMLEATNPNGTESSPVPLTLWDHHCF